MSVLHRNISSKRKRGSKSQTIDRASKMAKRVADARERRGDETTNNDVDVAEFITSDTMTRSTVISQARAAIESHNDLTTKIHDQNLGGKVIEARDKARAAVIVLGLENAEAHAVKAGSYGGETDYDKALEKGLKWAEDTLGDDDAEKAHAFWLAFETPANGYVPEIPKLKRVSKRGTKTVAISESQMDNAASMFEMDKATD